MTDFEEIQDYGMIGNGRSCALISRSGSLDWLCWPRFDSPSLFGGILDPEIGGSWKIHPTSKAEAERHYIENTNVLQTTFITETGKICLTDFMTAFSEEEKNQQLHPEHELLRLLECIEGKVEVEIHFDPRPNYGLDKVSINDNGKLGLRIEIGQQLIGLHSTHKFDLTYSEGAKAVTLEAGEKINLSLTFTCEGPAVIPPLSEDYVSYKLSRTIDWWQKWAEQSQYTGPYKNHVIRSALTLKLLGYAPSGSYIAAATTSLPERIGGNINWDYRYCWLRDASFTVRSLLGLGYWEEAEAFINWLLHSTRLTLPNLKPVYTVFGEGMTYEKELPHLKGYKNSQPIRIGIAIRDQLQLDVYGEVLDGVVYFVEKGGKLDREGKKLTRQIGEYVCKNWNQKDNGIWEDRSDLEYYTYSHLMCWVALDKLLKIKKECELSEKNIAEFEKNRSMIKEQIEKHAWNADLKAYTSYLNGNKMDACILLMPSFGFNESTSLRMQQTFSKIQETLGIAPGLIYRYEKSFGQEGAFLICSFWKVDFLAHGNSLEEAHNELKEILKFSNDLGLFAEEVDIKTNKLLGNFPQAFTHIGLINSAILLQEKEKK